MGRKATFFDFLMSAAILAEDMGDKAERRRKREGEGEGERQRENERREGGEEGQRGARERGSKSTHAAGALTGPPIILLKAVGQGHIPPFNSIILSHGMRNRFVKTVQ